MGQYPRSVAIPARLAVSRQNQGFGIGSGVLRDAKKYAR